MKTMQCPVTDCGDTFDVENDEELVAVMPVAPKGRTVGIGNKPVRHEHQIRITGEES
jgi:hypothetical protein